MARPTLLDMVQEILSAMSSDEINSIGDTTESLQVAMIIKRKFLDITARAALPENNQLFELIPSNDVLLPTLMYVPDNVSRIDWIKYFDASLANGTEDGYKYVTMLPVQQFIDIVNTFNPEESDVTAYTYNGYSFAYKNLYTPTYCTVISNKYVLFDTFNVGLESTLQATNTMCHGMIFPIFLMEDSFIPDLNDNEFPLLLNEAKALAFYELKQTPHAKAEQEIKRQWSVVSKNKSVANGRNFDNLPDFGRRGTYGRMNRRWWDGPRV